MFSLFAIAAASSVVAYGPPSNREALAAYEARVIHAVREAGDYAYEEILTYRPEYPSDVRLRKCVRKIDRGVRLDNDYIEYHNGYECVIEVWPNGAPSFTTSGLFSHDGIEWIYYGAFRQTKLPPISQFDPSPIIKGKTAVKPGALLYDGSPYKPMNPKYTPYQDYFEDTGWAEKYPYN